jgi:hypothetical protein
MAMAQARAPLTLSGPVSLHVFDVPAQAQAQAPDGGGGAAAGTNRVYVLGDEHHSYQNMCRPCSSADGCQTILAFIQGAVRRARSAGTQLDVLLELPYVVRDGPLRTEWLQTLDAYMSRDSGKRLLESEDRASSKAHYVGMLGVLYHAFRQHLYDDDAKAPGAPGSNNVRFHYSDARLEPHVPLLLPFELPDAMHRRVRTAEQLRALLEAFVFSRNFPRDVAKLIGPEETRRVLVPGALSSLSPAPSAPAVHKIAKQFHRLPDGDAKDAVNKYLVDRIDDAVASARDDLGFDTGAHVLAAGRKARAALEATATGAAGDAAMPLWQQNVLVAHERYYRSSYTWVMLLAVHLVLMDAYLVCRLMRFATRAPGGECIVYVGNAHAKYYVAFLQDYLNLTPIVCQPIQIVHKPKRPSRMSSGDSNLSRCVPVLRHDRRATCPSIGRHPLTSFDGNGND